ncbi:ribbon-helix-helix domain-containing protein [Psychroserpens sp.]
MSRLPTSENTEVLTIRISPKLKDKLNQLAKKNRYGSSASEVVRYLIEYHSKR